MFKAKLIDDPAYYRLRKKMLLVGFPVAALLGIFFGQMQTALPYFVGTLIVLGLYTAWRIRTHKRASSMVRNRSIEISSDNIRILSGHGKILETISVGEQDRLVVKEAYAIPEETIHDLIREIKGKGLENYMLIRRGEEEIRFDFFLDSYYMIEQLKKIIADWQARGLDIQTVE
ncbi:MAG: hypothetical protein K9I85_04510 [Saprospiraceae bacterium]|nr:hypothetical protein [Saprospiraceae bacterium]